VGLPVSGGRTNTEATLSVDGTFAYDLRRIGEFHDGDYRATHPKRNIAYRDVA
jgi:hypothetical protein